MNSDLDNLTFQLECVDSTIKSDANYDSDEDDHIIDVNIIFRNDFF